MWLIQIPNVNQQIKKYNQILFHFMRSGHNKYLPNWELAKTHGTASRVGTYHEEDPNMCPCCQQKIEKQQIPLCENTKSLEFLGFGFPLFYMFIRNCIILLILLIISNNFISLYMSISDGNQFCSQRASQSTTKTPAHFLFNRQFIHEEDQKVQSSTDENYEHLSNQCNNFMILFARTDRQQRDYEFILRIGSFIIHVLGLLYIKDKIMKTWQYYDEVESDLSDYAVLIKRIPPNTTGVKGRLTSMIQNEFISHPYNVHEIILIPQSSQIYQLQEQEQKATEHYLKANKQNDPQVHHYLQQLQKINRERHEYVHHTISEIQSDKISAQNAIIFFQTQPEKQDFLEKVSILEQQNKIGKYFDNPQESIVIVQAPEPREIIYQNLPYQKDRVRNLLIGWGLSLLFLVLITVVFYFLQLIKTNNLVAAIQEQEQNPSRASTRKTFATVLAWVTLLGIVLFNKFVMGRVLHYFTHLQKHDNKAHEDFSFAFKYALGMFFTTAIMTILVQALKYHNYYKHDFGVIEQQTIMFFLCAFLVPIIWLINPFQLYHLYERNHHYGHSDVSQHEANHLMADYHYDMGKRYAEIIEMMWFTFLYADLIPLGAFLILVGFCIYYWVDKFNLLRRASLEGNISGDLAMKALFLLDLTLFWRFLGELIFDVQIRDGAKGSTLLFLGLSVIYLIIPWEKFLDLVNSESFKLNQKTFTSQKTRFKYDNYLTYHPIYSHAKHLDRSENKSHANIGSQSQPKKQAVPVARNPPMNLNQPTAFSPLNTVPTTVYQPNSVNSSKAKVNFRYQ